MIRTVLAVVVTATGVVTVAAQLDLVEQRSALMKTQGQHTYAVLNRIVRGESAYDQANVDESFAKLAGTSPKIASLFPESTKGLSAPTSQFTASSKIWENKAD